MISAGDRLVRLLAHLAPALFSAVVWLWLFVLAPAGFAAAVAVGVAVMLGGSTPAGLAWRYRVRRATGEEAAAVLAGVIANRGLRGRGQPRVWVHRRPVAHQIVSLTAGDLAVSEPFLVGLLRGRIEVEEASAAAAFAVGRRRAGDGTGWRLLGLFCGPWRLAEGVVRGVLPARLPLTGVLWRARPVVFVGAMVQSGQAGRGGVVLGLVALLTLTYLHPWAGRCWAQAVERAGDTEVIAQGLGAVYARMIRRTFHGAPAEARARRLTQPTRPARTGV